jgi:membrane-associated protein
VLPTHWLSDGLDLFLHLDRHLGDLIARVGGWTYLVLFLVIFCETGLVLTPFLPGDSLLFAAGTFAGIGDLDIALLYAALALASILGDTTNYWVGRLVGERAFTANPRLLRREYLERTRQFYLRYGRRTIVIARFVPIVRTFAPFVAGVGQMPYLRFLSFSVAGSLLWVGLFTLGGFLFGNIPVVRRNFSLVVLVIIALSVMPAVLHWFQTRRARTA